MDLSLIRLFIVIYEAGNISRAANILNLSQPTVTYNLNLLRKKLDNNLFERTQYGVKPTQVADKLYPIFRESISKIEFAIAGINVFDPLTAQNTFRLCVSDIGEIIIVPILIEYLKDHAPNIKLEIREVKSDLVENWLIDGCIDAAIFNSANREYKSLEYKSLFHEEYVCLVNNKHPIIKEEINLQSYLNASHIEIKAATGENLVDKTLRELGKERQIKLSVPHFGLLSGVLATSNLIATLPIRVAKEYLKNQNLCIFNPPFKIPGFNVGMSWFARHEDPVAQKWFLECCQTVVMKL